MLFLSCEFFKKEELGIPVARVNNIYLYQDDVKNLVSEETSKEDSTVIVNNFINRWATQQLLISNAKINLSLEKQSEFDRLVEQYKRDLYSKAYQEALVSKSVDTSVSVDEAREIYESNKEIYKLNEELIKFRYISLKENSINLDDIKKRFKRFDNSDKRVLDSIAIQFRSYSLNDSIWIRADQAISKISPIKAENKKELLKKSNFIELKDSLGLYLMQINDVLLRNEIAPIEFVMPTIKQIVINKRKLEFIKQLEKDITKDAIKNKQFELFN
ncbi:MAG: peptidylprolyl isomerase [Bacteroidetes bacterium]|nr:MAG: peptidylprolyl isomerase [Bacteroidota bacterium]